MASTHGCSIWATFAHLLHDTLHALHADVPLISVAPASQEHHILPSVPVVSGEYYRIVPRGESDM